MMTAEEMWLYKEQLKLQIMQAQSAAMSGEDNLYQQSVANAKALLNDKFDTDAPEINGALSTLDALGEANVQENLPEELSAMAPLQRLLESRVKAAYGKGEAAQ